MAPARRPYRTRPERYPGERRDQAGRAMAARLWPVLPMCERCGVNYARHRHHLNGNTWENERENLLFVCDACHRAIHGQEEDFGNQGRLRAPLLVTAPVPCAECGRMAKPTRRGLCHACYERHRRRGDWG